MVRECPNKLLLSSLGFVGLTLAVDHHPLGEKLLNWHFLHGLVTEAIETGPGRALVVAAANLFESKDDHLPQGTLLLTDLGSVGLVVVAVTKLADVFELRAVSLEQVQLPAL